jgi:two-component system response regulator HydG
MQTRVLIIDDDERMREAMEVVVAADGHDCVLAESAVNALKIVNREPFDAVICDVLMDGMDGLELLDRVKRAHPTLPFIMITGVGGVNQAVDAMKRGAFEYVVKPCGADELRKIVATAISMNDREVESTTTTPPVSLKVEIVGTGPAMQAMQTAIDFVARSSAPVLITGETGVGKELAARTIHARSARRDHGFVAVNMSAIPAELMEGEMFGHVRGAFTGAARARKGLFTEADGGTLLLDEIGDMPFALQAKLLRVLQFGEVRPVGSERSHHVNVRVITATHQDLPALVKEGRFREDLFYRLDVLRVHVPALRDHREDIPALTEYFFADACARTPLSPVRALDPETLRAFSEASWPGNVRELANVIERAVVFGVVDVGTSAPTSTQSWSIPAGAPWTLRRLSRAYTEWVLAQSDGNKERAAAALGIDLSTLYRWQRAKPD